MSLLPVEEFRGILYEVLLLVSVPITCWRIPRNFVWSPLIGQCPYYLLKNAVEFCMKSYYMSMSLLPVWMNAEEFHMLVLVWNLPIGQCPYFIGTCLDECRGIFWTHFSSLCPWPEHREPVLTCPCAQYMPRFLTCPCTHSKYKPSTFVSWK